MFANIEKQPAAAPSNYEAIGFDLTNSVGELHSMHRMDAETREKGDLMLTPFLLPGKVWYTQLVLIKI